MRRKTFTLRIDCDNAAYDDDLVAELKRVIKLARWQVSNQVHDDGMSYMNRVHDLNGNVTGRWDFNVWEDEDQE